jgi:hypothetical protein
MGDTPSLPLRGDTPSLPLRGDTPDVSVIARKI